jgi:hypothetical protein
MKQEDPIDALEARLRRAARAGAEPELGQRWKAGVMDAVRAEAARAAADAGPSAERLVRNAFLAAAAAAALAMAAVGARAAVLDPTLEVARLLASDPQGLLQLALVM